MDWLTKARWSLPWMLAFAWGCGEITVAPVSGDSSGTPSTAECETDDDCEPTLPCHASAFCSAGACSYTVMSNACVVGGQCYEAGAAAFGDKCQVCDPTTSSGAFTGRACSAGTSCDPSTGECVAETADVVVLPDAEPDAGLDTLADADSGPNVPDVADTPETDAGLDPDAGDPPDEGQPDTGVECAVNADCAGLLELDPCEGAVCVAGACQPFTLPEGSKCSLSATSSECFEGTCNAEGACQGQPLSNTACDDADPCTLGDVCQEGLCVGSAKSCNDGDPCTQDSCDAETGECTSIPWEDGGEVILCDDGNACTAADACMAGECVGGENDCDCETDEDCDGLEDGNLCNGTFICAETGGALKCVVDPATVVSCDTSGDSPCAVTVCQPDTGQCQVDVLTGASCDDGDKCTFADDCDAGGQCAGTPKQCGDDNVCTSDSCLAGACVQTPVSGPCSDGDPCTSADACTDGLCAGEPVVCDDGNPCTDDSCGAGGCVHTPKPGTPCTDPNHCTTGDTCTCAGEGCATIACTGTPVACNDGNPCTDDACLPGLPPAGYDPTQPQTACVATANAKPCSDGDACSVGDLCIAGACQSGPAPLTCAAGPCEKAACDPDQGCVITPVADGTGCDDDNPCTDGDSCQRGACESGTLICTCTGNGDCDDGNACNGQETCVAGPGGILTCQPGTKLVCLPGTNPCQKNTCDSATGQCTLTPIADGTACGPDDACVVGRTCQGGQCQGTTLPCEAGACEVVAGCDPTTGCQVEQAPAGTACDDGSACTDSDACGTTGACAGKKLLCDDLNPCTKDTCQADVGCVHADLADGATCEDDGNLCTGEQCKAGSCEQVSVQTCNDGVSCTSDACNPASGQCEYEPNHAACDDKNSCTTDTCSQTGCKSTGLGDFTACSDGDSTTGPDLCFQSACAGGTRVQPSFGLIFLCPVSGYQALDLTTSGTAFFALGTGASGSYTFPNGCTTPKPFWSVYSLTASGSSLKTIGSQPSALTTLDNRVVAGSGGKVGLISADGDSVDWNSSLKTAVDSAGGKATSFNALDHATAGPIFFQSNYYLLAGRTSSAGQAMLCSGGSSWSCSLKNPGGSGGPKLSVMDFRGATLYTQATKCPQPPCIAGTELGGGWLASASTDSYFDTWHAATSALSFDYSFYQSGAGALYRGTVLEGGDVAWHYGHDGLLVRCDGTSCQAVDVAPGQTSYDFEDAWAYSGGLVLMSRYGSAGKLLFLKKGADYATWSSWVEHTFAGKSGDVLRSIAGTTTDGIYVWGQNGQGTAYTIYRWLRK